MYPFFWNQQDQDCRHTGLLEKFIGKNYISALWPLVQNILKKVTYGKFAPLIKLYRIIFGIEDFHSHIRWDMAKRVISQKEKTLKIGAGNGIMSINYLKMFKKDIDLLVYYRKDIHVAKEITDKLFSNINSDL